MKNPFLVSLFVFCFSCVALRAQTPLPRSAPEQQGVSSVALLELITALDAIDTMNSVMIVRNGHVITEGWWAPYTAESKHELYSLSKSFTSTAVGLLIADGKLSVDDEVLKFFPEVAPAEPSANLKAMRVRDILSMVTGHQDEPPVWPHEISTKSFLAQPVPHKPGTHFKYNTGATFMQSAIVQKLTNQTVLAYLQPRLLEPLGITGATWATNLEGISLGGYGLKIRTEDIAKFGQLYLQRGQWNGQQLVPAAWVDAATSKQVSNGSNPASDWDQGYGYQFWRCRHGVYRGDGAFGQYCIVLPEENAVVVITSGVRNMQAVLNLLWERLLPALQAQAISADTTSTAKLKEKIKSLAVRFPSGTPESPRAKEIFGRQFLIADNALKLQSLTLRRSADGRGVEFVTTVDGVEMNITGGFENWQPGRGAFHFAGSLSRYDDEPLATSAAWETDDTLVLKICAYETPFYKTIRLRFTGDTVTIDSDLNVGFGPTKQPQLTGKAR
ncbi:serine hydrolase domain-containing protein [Oleiharenicola lentus]|uniref:serine hydrolase domain-containing protein n=1 Tax=Oleiharenicola lentus TaxID=2508720 RepID=UPI003F67AC2D